MTMTAPQSAQPAQNSGNQGQQVNPYSLMQSFQRQREQAFNQLAVAEATIADQHDQIQRLGAALEASQKNEQSLAEQLGHLSNAPA